MNKDDFIDEAKSKLNSWFGIRPRLNHVLKTHPIIKKVTIWFFSIMFFMLAVVGLYSLIVSVYPSKPEPILTPMPRALGIETENPIEERVNNEKNDKKCDGAVFDILNDLSEVGGEHFTLPNKHDEYIASVSGELYQGSRKTVWECHFPFTATLSVVPKGDKSIGLFFDVEGINKLIVGDGDMKSVKIQKNDIGEMGEWEKFYRKYLDIQISKNKELKIINRQKIESGMIRSEIEIMQAGWDKPILINDIPLFKPDSVILENNMEIKFRIGINDWLYKGLGSNVRLQTFSIKEGEW